MTRVDESKIFQNKLNGLPLEIITVHLHKNFLLRPRCHTSFSTNEIESLQLETRRFAGLDLHGKLPDYYKSKILAQCNYPESLTSLSG